MDGPTRFRPARDKAAGSNKSIEQRSHVPSEVSYHIASAAAAVVVRQPSSQSGCVNNTRCAESWISTKLQQSVRKSMRSPSLGKAQVRRVRFDTQIPCTENSMGPNEQTQPYMYASATYVYADATGVEPIYTCMPAYLPVHLSSSVYRCLALLLLLLPKLF